MIKSFPIVQCINWFITHHVPARTFQENYVAVRWVGKFDDFEGSFHPGVKPGGESYDLYGYIRFACGFDQSAELASHSGCAANSAPDDGLVEHEVKSWCRCPLEQFFPPGPQFHEGGNPF